MIPPRRPTAPGRSGRPAPPGAGPAVSVSAVRRRAVRRRLLTIAVAAAALSIGLATAAPGTAHADDGRLLFSGPVSPVALGGHVGLDALGRQQRQAVPSQRLDRLPRRVHVGRRVERRRPVPAVGPGAAQRHDDRPPRAVPAPALQRLDVERPLGRSRGGRPHLDPRPAAGRAARRRRHPAAGPGRRRGVGRDRRAGVVGVAPRRWAHQGAGVPVTGLHQTTAGTGVGSFVESSSRGNQWTLGWAWPGDYVAYVTDLVTHTSIEGFFTITSGGVGPTLDLDASCFGLDTCQYQQRRPAGHGRHAAPAGAGPHPRHPSRHRPGRRRRPPRRRPQRQSVARRARRRGGSTTRSLSSGGAGCRPRACQPCCSTSPPSPPPIPGS